MTDRSVYMAGALMYMSEKMKEIPLSGYVEVEMSFRDLSGESQSTLTMREDLCWDYSSYSRVSAHHIWENVFDVYAAADDEYYEMSFQRAEIKIRVPQWKLIPDVNASLYKCNPIDSGECRWNVFIKQFGVKEDCSTLDTADVKTALSYTLEKASSRIERDVATHILEHGLPDKVRPEMTPDDLRGQPTMEDLLE
jgi:hypothetical protein